MFNIYCIKEKKTLKLIKTIFIYNLASNKKVESLYVA